MAIKRIIPISSGKGGVGKTTFAVNFSLCLARHGRTVLVDLDTGTSSVRNAIDTPISRDLYHFFKKGEPLGNCITRLDWKLDPREQFRNFGFVAGPMHLIEEITNFRAERKQALIEAINGLEADYVVLDMKAGVDANVLDFLPWSNSGILIFTPHLPAATLAASGVVKAILFRKLRLIFSRTSPFYTTVDQSLDFFRMTNDLIDRVEDVYDDSAMSLDEFAADLFSSLGDHPIAQTVQKVIDDFRVHYVLNLFDGLDESFDTAVKPFVENVTRNISARPSITNFGWISRSDAIHRANCERIPALLFSPEQKTEKRDRYLEELENLRTTAIGLETPKKRTRPAADRRPLAEPADHLGAQLTVLREMFDRIGSDDYRSNFEYVTRRALFTMQTRRAAEFGDRRIFTPWEILDQMFERSALSGRL